MLQKLPLLLSLLLPTVAHSVYIPGGAMIFSEDGRFAYAATHVLRDRLLVSCYDLSTKNLHTKFGHDGKILLEIAEPSSLKNLDIQMWLARDGSIGVAAITRYEEELGEGDVAAEERLVEEIFDKTVEEVHLSLFQIDTTGLIKRKLAREWTYDESTGLPVFKELANGDLLIGRTRDEANQIVLSFLSPTDDSNSWDSSDNFQSLTIDIGNFIERGHQVNLADVQSIGVSKLSLALIDLDLVEAKDRLFQIEVNLTNGEHNRVGQIIDPGQGINQARMSAEGSVYFLVDQNLFRKATFQDGIIAKEEKALTRYDHQPPWDISRSVDNPQFGMIETDESEETGKIVWHTGLQGKANFIEIPSGPCGEIDL